VLWPAAKFQWPLYATRHRCPFLVASLPNKAAALSREAGLCLSPYGLDRAAVDKFRLDFFLTSGLRSRNHLRYQSPNTAAQYPVEIFGYRHQQVLCAQVRSALTRRSHLFAPTTPGRNLRQLASPGNFGSRRV